MSEQPTERERYQLSEAENQRIFHERLVPQEFPRLRAATNPVAHFFGAQPGAGKSVVQGDVHDQLYATNHPDTVMSIIGDEFRPYHPEYNRLLVENDERAAYYTDSDTARWIERAIELSYEIRPNVILEGTLRNPNVTVNTAMGYKTRDTATELHVVAVHEFISRLRIFGRYFDQISRFGQGRYTTQDAHDRAYVALPNSLSVIAEATVFDRITLHETDGTLLISVDQHTPETRTSLRSVLERQRIPETVNASAVLGELHVYESLAQEHGRTEVLNDIQSLRHDIRRALGWGNRV